MMTSEIEAGVSAQQLAAEARASLASLHEVTEMLRELDVTRKRAGLAELLAAIGDRASDFEEHVARLGPHTTAPVVDAANELTEAADTLATRWDGLVGSRRRSLVDVLTGAHATLDRILLGIERATIVEPAAPTEDGMTAKAEPRPRPPTRDAAKAWEAWREGPADARPRALFLELSRSWIEGTGAQLIRDERGASSGCTNATEVTERLAHHLAALAGAGDVSYMDALALARRRVIDEMHGRRAETARS
jgi:hypothetical protein